MALMFNKTQGQQTV